MNRNDRNVTCNIAHASQPMVEHSLHILFSNNSKWAHLSQRPRNIYVSPKFSTEPTWWVYECITSSESSRSIRVSRQISKVWVLFGSRRSAFEHTQHVRIHIILHMRKVSSGFFLSIDAIYSIQWFLFEDNQGPDQTAQMRRLIWVFSVRICLKTCFRMARLI